MISLLLTVITLSISAQNADVTVKTGTFGNDWESLSQWECPEWFKDAKFGIWAHWGPQCQAEDGDWYARFMYYEGSGQYNYHVSHFGNPSTFGLKDLCNAWKADKWDPQELVSLYKSVGARYFMALGNHHDNFDMWNSPYQEWNTVNVGPKKDIIKGWSDACKAEGLPLGVSIHASHAWTWLEPSQNYDGNLTKADGTGKWWEGMDPQELYAQNHPHSTGWANSGTIHSQWEWGNGASQPSEAYKKKFQNRVLELINDYEPDMIYFDDTAMPFYGCDDQVGKNILQHYYNHSAAQHDGKPDVLVTGKQLTDAQKEYMMWDVERGVPDRPQQAYWQTCTCIGQWHYDQNVYNNNSYKSGATVVRMLIDVVSKNGNLLLSVPVKGNGTIDDKEKKVLADIKAWMDINSESIYGTRMWKTFGEGPLAEAVNPMNNQGFNEGQNYSSKDVRYVTKEDAVYATIMDWPAAGPFTFKAFSIAQPSYSGKVQSVALLGYGEVEFSHTIKGLTVTIPTTKPNVIAPVFKVTFVTDNRTAYEKLQGTISEEETTLNELQSQVQAYNTGKLSPAKYEQLRTAIQQAKETPEEATDQQYDDACEKLISAFRNFLNNSVNKGGAFTGVIDNNITKEQLIEAENFTRSAGGTKRFGAPKYWTVENFNIPNGNDGTKQGLDKYTGKESLMIGVWNDRENNTSGSLEHARIYRKITLPAGKYYFGAAYNVTHNLNEEAYMFVSRELSNSAEIPQKSIAFYNLNKCSSDKTIQGLYFQLDEETEVYIGFQADMLNGSPTQEFRAEQVCLYTLKELGERHSEDKGWSKIEALPDDVSQYFFALYDHDTDNGLVLSAGNKQGASYQTMWYEEDVYPEGNKNALFTFDAFNEDNNSGVKGDNLKWLIITSAGNPNVCLQSNDAPNDWNFRTENNGDGWTDRAYVSPAYVKNDLPSGYWTFTNHKSNALLGHLDGTNEISGSATAENEGHYDIYAIERGKYVSAVENIDKASEQNPIDISYVINNADGTRYNKFHAKQPVGWTLSLENAFEIEYGNYLEARVGTSYFNKWQSSGNLTDRTISQQLTALPIGKYRLSVRTSSNVIHPGAYLFINSEKADMTKLKNNTITVTAETADGTLTFGVELKNYQSFDCKFDHFTLEYLGNGATTGIDDASRLMDNGKRRMDNVVYNLNGQKLRANQAQLKKGFYIINGQKIIVK